MPKTAVLFLIRIQEHTKLVVHVSVTSSRSWVGLFATDGLHPSEEEGTIPMTAVSISDQTPARGLLPRDGNMTAIQCDPRTVTEGRGVWHAAAGAANLVPRQVRLSIVRATDGLAATLIVDMQTWAPRTPPDRVRDVLAALAGGQPWHPRMAGIGLISCRYLRLFLVSGDHIFTPLAQKARSLGVTVQIVSGPGLVCRVVNKTASLRTSIRPTSRDAQRRALAAIRTVHAAAVAA